LAEGKVGDRANDVWRVWYRRSTEVQKWYQATCSLRENGNVTVIKGIIREDEEGNLLNNMRIWSVEEYTKRITDELVFERDPRKESVRDSPHRTASDAQAYKEAKKLGAKRIITKFSKVKNVLEVGDVVHVPVHYKNRSSSGDTNLLGLVHKVLGHGHYTVVTHAGPLAMKLSRNEITLQQTLTKATVAIDEDVMELPPISEKDALMLINPMRNDGVFCKCKMVRPSHDNVTFVLCKVYVAYCKEARVVGRVFASYICFTHNQSVAEAQPKST
jgi:hypothetical protein